MATVPVRVGRASFNVPHADKECFTWYQVSGNLSEGIPLILLHGGPGSGHNTLLGYQDLTTHHQIPVVWYDQLGCENSTLLPEKDGDTAFWTIELFEQELDNLATHLGLQQFDILGHSWGGILGSMYASKRPSRLRKLILTHTPASIPLLEQGMIQLRARLSQSSQDALREADSTGDFKTTAYKEACKEFEKSFWCRLDEIPSDMLASKNNLKDNPVVYKTMYGPTEVTCTGSLKDWSAIPHLHKIQNTTLVINGQFDEVAEIASAPFFEEIPKVKWIILPNSSHQSMWEERERVMENVSRFLKSKA